MVADPLKFNYIYIVIIIVLIGLWYVWVWWCKHCSRQNIISFFDNIQSHNIPLVIHQTWKYKELYRIPKKYHKCVESWKYHNPEFEHILYDDVDCMDFVKTHYPQYLELYTQLELPVQKADVFRYLILHKWGGIYTDLDTICLHPIRELLTHPMIVGIEYEPQHNNGKTQIIQWFFGSVPGNPILLEVVDEINNRQKLKNTFGINICLTFDGRNPTNTDDHTLWLTGPFIFSDIIMKHTSHVTESDNIKIYPRCTLGSFDTTTECLNKAYLLHTFEGSWKDNTKPYKFNLKKIKRIPFKLVRQQIVDNHTLPPEPRL